MVPFGLLLGATNQQIGWLVAIPNLISALAQAWSVSVVHHIGSRLRLLTRGVFAQAILLTPIGFLPFLPIEKKILALTVFFSVFKMITGLLGPAWGSLVSEYLPPHRRGDYFGWRSRLLSITTLVTLAFWGVFLYAWKKWVSTEAGFLLMFSTAAIARFVSFYYIGRMTDLPYRKTKESEFTLWMFVRRFRESNFVKFVFYVSGITFTTHIASPYFSVHMLRDLKFDYLSFMAISLASTIAGLIAVPIWGRHADHVGNARILKTTGTFATIIPLFWLFLHHVVPLFFVEAFAGVMWGGFNLCAVNYIYDAVSPEKRVRCLGYFNLINGSAIFAGAALGGWMSSRVPPIFGFSLLSVFLISSISRLVIHLLLSDTFQEVRPEVKKVSSMQLFFSVVGLYPMIGRNSETTMLSPRTDFSTKRR